MTVPLSSSSAPSGHDASVVSTGLSAAALAVPIALLAALPGLIYAAGFDHLAFGLGLLAGVVLGGVWIAPKLTSLGAGTPTEALALRFGRPVMYLGAAVVVLVVIPLLAAELAIVGAMAEGGAGLPAHLAIFAAFALAIAGALSLGERTFRWLAAAAFAFFAATVLVPLVMLASQADAGGFPLVDYGRKLPDIAALEEKLLENGLIDFDTFSGHVAAFLKLSPLDVVALVVSLALGTAVLPPLLGAVASARVPAAARLAGAWTALFVMIVLVSAPALAVLAKLQIYDAMTSATPLSNLPPWLEAPLRANLAHIHGTSVHLLEAVADAVRSGSGTPAAVADALTLKIAVSAQWAALDPETQEAVMKAAGTLVAGPDVSAWDLYRTTVVPAAATAQGNAAQTLTQAALVIEPAGLPLALAEMMGVPRWVLLLVSVGIAAAALVMATALMRSLLALGSPVRSAPDKPTWRRPALLILVSGVAAAFAALDVGDLITIAVASLSLAAAGLFPVLAIGLSWRRVTAAAAAAAIVTGAGMSLYYDIGIQAFPASFYKTWPSLSNASEPAIEEFNAREEAWRNAETDDAKGIAATALDDWARGAGTRPGLANWGGIDSASSAVFAVPVGLVTLILVSLLTGRRRASSDQP